ncbi:MAG: recombinase family protein [Clostridia bacterium]|nr:recombinase family protein [Clostridia bacterium]MBR4537247.1 recombinase family protein [Clostridia bacterium]MBR4540522.1 recombinase family protein [Clostridia bacterium]
MSYCMYLRKSRADLEAEARGEGETLSRHLHTLTLLAARLNIDVAPSAIYREIVSGDTIAARPMMQRLLEEVQRGMWEGVLCTEVERLARGDTIDQGIVAQAFRVSGTRIITPAKTYDPNNEIDEEYFEFSLFMARREYKAIKRRMQAGRAASVREGHYVGGKRPFGYQVVKCTGSKGYTLQQIPEEARIVRLAYDYYLHHGLGTAAIANRLNAMGSTTYNGHTWDANSVRKMLLLPIYAGYVQWLKRESKPLYKDGVLQAARPLSDRYILAKGLHEGIVTPEEYDQVRALAESRRCIAHVDNKHISNPLAGLIKCGLCGYAITRRNNTRGVFLCCKNPVCSCSSAYMDVVLSVILDTLRGYVIQYEGQAAPPVPAPVDHSQELSAANQALATARRQLTAAKDLLEKGIYSIEEFLERRTALNEKIAASEAEISRLTAASAQPPESQAAQIIRALPQIRRVLDAWPYATTPADQNALLRSILSRVTYSKTGPLTRDKNPRDSVSLSLSFLPTPEEQ